MIQGVLLAAGSASRFGGHKLLHPLTDGTPIGVAAARNLLRGTPTTLAVVRPDDHELTALLRAEGVTAIICETAELGISASLAAGVQASADADGWLIALADMPWISPETIRALVGLLEKGAQLVAPYYAGRRGHPVGFARRYKVDLLELSGDSGARDLLQANHNRLRQFHCDDRGILRDVDVPADAID